MTATLTATIVPHNWGWVARWTGDLQTEGRYKGQPELEFARKGKSKSGEWGARVTEPGVYTIQTTRDASSRRYQTWDGLGGKASEHWADIPDPRTLFRQAPDLFAAAIGELGRPDRNPEDCAVCGELITIQTSIGWWACETHHADLEPVTSQPPADKEAPF